MKIGLVLLFISSLLSAGLGAGQQATNVYKDVHTKNISRIEAQLAQAR
jgi:hypothetical protein